MEQEVRLQDLFKFTVMKKKPKQHIQAGFNKHLELRTVIQWAPQAASQHAAGTGQHNESFCLTVG